MTNMHYLVSCVAGVALHEANRIYTRHFTQDGEQPAWDDAPDSTRIRMKSIAELIRTSPDKTPQETHEAFLKAEIAKGWTYGPERDAEAKQSPYIRPWEELTSEEQAKSALGPAVVKAVWRAFGMLDAAESGEEG